jgi:hypothetical protein
VWLYLGHAQPCIGEKAEDC